MNVIELDFDETMKMPKMSIITTTKYLNRLSGELACAIRHTGSHQNNAHSAKPDSAEPI